MDVKLLTKKTIAKVDWLFEKMLQEGPENKRMTSCTAGLEGRQRNGIFESN